MAKSYIELSSSLYGTLVESMGAANQRALSFGKSVYEIASRPYTSTAVDAALRENFDRMNQIVEATVAEVQQNGQHATDFTQKMLEHGAAVQETLVETGRTMAKTGASNMAFVKDAADAQSENFAKTVNDMQARAASVSAN